MASMMCLSYQSLSQAWYTRPRWCWVTPRPSSQQPPTSSPFFWNQQHGCSLLLHQQHGCSLLLRISSMAAHICFDLSKRMLMQTRRKPCETSFPVQKKTLSAKRVFQNSSWSIDLEMRVAKLAHMWHVPQGLSRPLANGNPLKMEGKIKFWKCYWC